MRFASLVLAIGLTASPAATAVDSKPAPAPTPTKPAPAKTITGKVAGPDGKPVAGAIVRAIPVASKDPGFRGRGADVPKPIVVKTDANGTFKLEGAPPGAMTVRVEAPGLAPALVPDAPAGAALSLKLKPGTQVVGRVLDLTTQKPVANATVTALEREASRFGRDAAHTVKSAEDGTFRIPNCSAGVVVLEAIAPAKARARLDKVVARPLPEGTEPKFETNTLFLQPGGRIAGKVVGGDGKPIADAIVTAAASDGALFAMVRDARSAQWTGEDGTFVFDGIVAGNKYTIRAVKEGMSSREEGPIPVEAATDRSDLELKLDAGATLAFRLVTAQELPVKDVDIRLQPVGRRRGMMMSGNDVDRDKIAPLGDGKFQIKALDAGTFDLTLMPVDFSDVTREGIRLKSGETTDLGTLKVKESKSIAGRIADGNGQPVGNASISGFSLDGEMRFSREVRSAADGTYRLSGLGDQPLRSLTVRAEGYADATREGAVPGDTDVDFTLEKTGSIVGKVLLRGGVAPAAFRVRAFPEAKESQERPGFRVVISGRPDEDQIYTDATGNFRLDGVNPGIVTVTATSDGKAPTKKTGVKVAPDQIVDAGTIVLDDGRALRGRVVAAKDDAPVPGTTVSVAEPQGMRMMAGRNDTLGTAITGLDGRFEIAGLEPRTYAVDASQPDYSPNSGRVEISPDTDTDDFVIKLSRGGAITGVVRDAQKQPLPNVSVLMTKVPMGGGPQTVSTGPDGRYAFEKVPPGQYTVLRAPTGGGPLMLFGGMKQVDVKEGETAVHDIDEAAKITLTGRVLRGGQPVASSILFFRPMATEGLSSDLKQSRTDADGRYQVGLDAAGPYSVTVAAMRSMWVGGGQGISIEVPDQPSAVVDITVKSSGIAGRVTNNEGKPVSGAVVTVTPSDAAGGGEGGHGRPSGTQDNSDPDGSFLVDGLDPGVYKVNVAAVGYRNAQPPAVTIANDSDVPSLDIRLEPGRSVRGRVVDANGNGISSAWVFVAPAGSTAGREMLPAVSDVNGTFVLTAPADGAIDLAAVAAGFPPARVTGVQPQDGVDVVLRAPRPAHVRVNVLDPTGRPVPDARVAYRAVPAFLGENYMRMSDGPAPTDNDGKTTINAVGPGSYELTVTHRTKTATGAVSVAEGAETVTTVTLP